MKFLKEDWGESEELENFIYCLQKRFNPYWEVILKLDGRTSINHFAYEDAAREYHDKVLEDIKNDREYYDGARLTFNKVTLHYDEDELDDDIFWYEEEEEETSEEKPDDEE